MPKIIEQPDDINPLLRLNNSTKARATVLCGHNKWNVVQHQIEHVVIGGRRFYTDQALLDYVKRQTRKPAAPEPKERRTPARKVVAIPPRGKKRGKVAAATERENSPI